MMTEIGSDTKDEGIERAILQAFESAQITAALKGEATKLYVLQMDIYSQLLEDDYSCDNMADMASFIDSDVFDRKMIKAIYVCDFNKWHSPILIKLLSENPMFSTCEIDEDLLHCAESLNDDCYLESEFDYSEIALKDFI